MIKRKIRTFGILMSRLVSQLVEFLATNRVHLWRLKTALKHRDETHLVKRDRRLVYTMRCIKLLEGTSCRRDRRRIEQRWLRHSRTFSSARAGICLASTSIWHDQRINPARIFPSARSSSGWRLPGMRFYRFVDPCPSWRRPCICMSTSTLPAYKASIEKHTDWTGRPSFSNATLPRPGTPAELPRAPE